MTDKVNSCSDCKHGIGLHDLEGCQVRGCYCETPQENIPLLHEIIRYRDALAYSLNMAGDYTTDENVRLALITQRCRDELAKKVLK